VWEEHHTEMDVIQFVNYEENFTVWLRRLAKGRERKFNNPKPGAIHDNCELCFTNHEPARRYDDFYVFVFSLFSLQMTILISVSRCVMTSTHAARFAVCFR
jgi:hypothetical protein